MEEDRSEGAGAWLADVGASLDRPPLATSVQLVIDARSGQVHSATPAAVKLLGSMPDHVEDLVAAGTIARPDYELLRDRVVATVRVAPVSEAAESWTTKLRLHPAGTPAVTAELHVAHHRRRNLGVEVVWIRIEIPADGTGVGTDASARDRATFVAVHDREARVIAVSEAASAVWSDLSALIGTVTTALVHPEDLAEIMPVAHALYSGSVPRASYTVRVAASDGRWVTLHNDARVVAGADDHFVVMESQIVDIERQLIPAGLLSEREWSIVSGLFDGLRPNQVAERDGVAIKTVRNQLASAYRKLGVSGQQDLLARYHRPTPSGR